MTMPPTALADTTAAPPSPAHCAIRLRAALTNLSTRLRTPPRDGGASVARLSVLGQLHRAGELSGAELARREGVKPQTLTRLLAELQSEGWIVRAPHPTDGRQALLSLSPQGAAFLGQEMKRREAALAEAIGSQLSAAERRLLMDASALLDRLADRLAAR